MILTVSKDPTFICLFTYQTFMDCLFYGHIVDKVSGIQRDYLHPLRQSDGCSSGGNERKQTGKHTMNVVTGDACTRYTGGTGRVLMDSP